MILNGITKRGDTYQVKGSSDSYETLQEAVNFVQRQKRLKKKKEGLYKFKFFSEKLGIGMRSSWEVELAELMFELGIKFKYEPQRFYFRAERESYLPDFYLPEYDCWIEVKGFMDKRSERRCKLFVKYHGKESGYFLFMKEERELVLNNPELIYTYIDIAKAEQRRRAGK